MVQSWYMDDRKGDPQDEHLLEEIDTVTLCARTGVEIWYFHPDQIMVENESPSLIKLKHDRGYTYEDEVKVDPSMEDYEEKLKTFFTEHHHSNEKPRLVLEGSAYFDVQDCEKKWIRIHVFPGDLIILPPGICHRFITDKQNYIRARRFFIGEPNWTSIDRSNGDTHSSHQIHVDTNKYIIDAII